MCLRNFLFSLLNDSRNVELEGAIMVFVCCCCCKSADERKVVKKDGGRRLFLYKSDYNVA